MTPNELSARMTKANKLMEVIIAAGGTSETAAMMNEEQWAMAEKVAGTRRSSEQTREMVIRFMKIREQVSKEDPFERLGRREG